MSVLPFPPRVDSADDMEASVATAQDMLAQASEVPAMRHDPFRLILGGLSAALGALVKTTRRWETATGNVVAAAAGVEAARQPFPQDERDALVKAVTEASREAVNRAARKEAGMMIRAFDRKVVMLVGAGGAGAFVLGSVLTLAVLAAVHVGPFSRDALAGAAWREVEQHNPDPRQALASASILTDPATGRRYYAGVSLWMDPPQAAPTSPRKP